MTTTGGALCSDWRLCETGWCGPCLVARTSRLGMDMMITTSSRLMCVTSTRFTARISSPTCTCEYMTARGWLTGRERCGRDSGGQPNGHGKDEESLPEWRCRSMSDPRNVKVQEDKFNFGACGSAPPRVSRNKGYRMAATSRTTPGLVPVEHRRQLSSPLDKRKATEDDSRGKPPPAGLVRRVGFSLSRRARVGFRARESDGGLSPSSSRCCRRRSPELSWR
jgi:hypothetical protein